MPDPKQGKSIADQIHDALWLCVSPRRNALDSEKLDLKNDVKNIIRQRNLPKLIEILELMGKGQNTEEGRKLIQLFKTMFGFD